MEFPKTHPMIVAAAAGVLLVSLLGAAALTGLLPRASSTASGDPKLAQQAAPKGAAMQQIATSKGPVAQQATPKGSTAPCTPCGVIESVRAVEVKGDASGLGAVAGGVAGAVVGSQLGRGDGRTLMTIAGAAGGAYAGNTIEQHVKKHTVYRVTVRLDDGSARTVSQASAPPFAVGDRVRIVNGNSLERA